MIKSFADRATEEFWRTGKNRKVPATIRRVAARKLQVLEAAKDLNDLRSPPGNRLEALKGDRLGQHSVRINDQFRVCFRWFEGDAYGVEITDYH
jgi:proteic killer suppression protein